MYPFKQVAVIIVIDNYFTKKDRKVARIARQIAKIGFLLEKRLTYIVIDRQNQIASQIERQLVD